MPPASRNKAVMRGGPRPNQSPIRRVHAKPAAAAISTSSTIDTLSGNAA